MPTSELFLEPVRTHIGWVRRVPHSDFTVGSLGAASLLRPAEAMRWVGLDHRKEADRAIWTYLCSGRVILEGVAPKGPRHSVHFQCIGAHSVDAGGAIAGLTRRGAVTPPSGVTWGYEPASVAQLRRTTDVPLLGGPNLADSLGVSIWMVGTSAVHTLDDAAIEPAARRANRRIPPKAIEAAARYLAATEFDALADALHGKTEADLVQEYGQDALVLARLLQVMPPEQVRELFARHATAVLRDRPDDLGLTPEQVQRSIRVRAASGAYIFYPAGPIELDLGGETVRATPRDGRISEVQVAYEALRTSGYFEELAPPFLLGDGVSLSPLTEAPTELPPPFTSGGSSGGRPVEYANFTNLRDHLLCAYLFPQYVQHRARSARSSTKTCAKPGCGKTFEADDGRVRRCPACQIGEAPEARRAYDRERKQEQRRQRRGEQDLSH